MATLQFSLAPTTPSFEKISSFSGLRCVSRVSYGSSISVRASSAIKCVASASYEKKSLAYYEKTKEFCMKAFHQRNALKVISGLDNFDAENVASVVKAAEMGGATHVDIAASPELVKLALSLTKLPICVSAVEPRLLVNAVKAGAHMVEIGNFDSFYYSGSDRKFSPEEVLAIAKETRALLPHVAISVTVPHNVDLRDQVDLAQELEQCGADIIQTEGGAFSLPIVTGHLSYVQKAAPTLAATYAICQAVKIPVMSASGLTSLTAPMAFALGASGVGIGSAVNKLSDCEAMVAAVRSIRVAMGSSWTTTEDKMLKM